MPRIFLLFLAGGCLVTGLFVGVGLVFMHARVVSADAAAISPSVLAPALPLVHHVQLVEDRAEPNTLAIKRGETVQFNSADEQNHDLAQGKGNDYDVEHGHELSGLRSGVFGPDEAYRLIFKETGVYFFHDHLHPDITATVIVYDKTK